MRKLIAVVLAVLVLVPCVSFSEISPAESSYSPDLNMTLFQFMNKYNAISSALGSSLVSLSSSNYHYFEGSDYNSFVFLPDSLSSIRLYIDSKDFEAGNVINAGVDRVEIVMSNSLDYPSFLTVAKRCAQMFSGDYFAESSAMVNIYELLISYYETHQNDSGFIISRQFNSVENYCIHFYMRSGNVCLEISKRK